jgi:hypothetical protein
MTKSRSLQISDSLIESVDAYLNQLPKTREEVIEKWAYLGKAVSEQLTELEQIQVMLGNGKITIELIDK